MNCRHCAKKLRATFLDLGFAPPSNAYLHKKSLNTPEVTFPLRVLVCENCWLVQTEDYTSAKDLFNDDYAYFSSTSRSWLEHSARYAEAITERLSLSSDSFVIEVACNDGYLLKNFVERRIPCLGVEPTLSTSLAAKAQGIEVIQEFFGEALARSLEGAGRAADLIIGNNVYAHVPDINDFTRGLKAALKHSGTITLEFPHLLSLCKQNQFDTVYHEHYSYLSLSAVFRIFEKFDLVIWHVQTLPTHGGSLRVFAGHAEYGHQISSSVDAMLSLEEESGLQDIDTLTSLQIRAEKVKNDLVEFLIRQKRCGKKVVGYGAAAKGNTLLNYGGVKPDLISYIADAADAKQGKYMPGSHIPISSPDRLIQDNPDFVLILPWNIAPEVIDSLQGKISSNPRFVTAIPEITIHNE